jgi:hypothetical protein
MFFSLLAVALTSLTGINSQHLSPRPSHDPTVDEFSYGPSTVTVEKDVFTATLSVSSTVGIDYVVFGATPPQGMWYPCPESTRFALKNGTIYDGTWEAQCGPLSADTPSQTYTIRYSAVNSEGDYATETFKQGFTASGGPDADYDAPAVSKVTCADTITAGSTLEVFVTYQDANVMSTDSYMRAHEVNGNMVACLITNFALYSGTSTDGVYKGSCTVPSNTANGDYGLEIHIYDTQHNYYQEPVENAFEVVGGASVDSVAPKISDFAYADSTVEIGQTLSVTATIQDLQSGVASVDFLASEFYVGTQFCKGPMTLLSGDHTTGVWVRSCEVPEGTNIGQFDGQINAYDNQNNKAFDTKGFNVVAP